MPNNDDVGTLEPLHKPTCESYMTNREKNPTLNSQPRLHVGREDINTLTKYDPNHAFMIDMKK